MPKYDEHGPRNREAAKARVAELLANRKPPKPEHLEREKRMEQADLDNPALQEPDE